MTRLLVTVFAFFIGFVSVIPEAEAKRLGGSRSFGMQRDSNSFRKATPPSNTATQPSKSSATNTAGPTPKRSWMGPLAGLAAGLGLAALMSHLGLGEEFGSIVLMALLAFAAIAVIRMLLRRAGGPSPSPAGVSPAAMQYTGRAETYGTQTDPRATSKKTAVAADFDAAAFERQAKLNFIRLQAASDAGNLEDIRNFTTPEVFAELSLQMAERSTGTHKTDVLELDAEVLDVSELEGQHVVTVRFSGMLREEDGAVPARFEELWHLVKPIGGNNGWRVAGLQQIG